MWDLVLLNIAANLQSQYAVCCLAIGGVPRRSEVGGKVPFAGDTQRMLCVVE